MNEASRTGMNPNLVGDTVINDQASQAAASLELLLREDPRLEQYKLTSASSNPDQVAFPYAAALLKDAENESGSIQNTQQTADIALQDVDRKLALVESLAVKLSRTSPEAVAGHLLRLHGYRLENGENSAKVLSEDAKDTLNSATDHIDITPTGTTTLSAIRDRTDRLERQAGNLEGIAVRVENTLSRGLRNMESATLRLSRVLNLSNTLKRIMRIQFEASKLQTYDLEDLRDLTRAAASVAVLEELLNSSDTVVIDNDSNDQNQAAITVIERMKPQILQKASAVRKAASSLLQDLLNSSSSGSINLDAGTTHTIQQLGATLQVYFHLGELHDAVWKAIDHAHKQTEAASRQLYNAVTLVSLHEKAKKSSKDARSLQRCLKQVRSDAAQEWADAILVAATMVRNLNRVLCRKTDHMRRQVYIDVVGAATLPVEYVEFSNTTTNTKDNNFSLFRLFWARFCHSLSLIIESILEHDNGRFRDDVSSLYPAVRSAALGLVGQLQNSNLGSQTPMSLTSYDDSTYAPSDSGILGGSTLLEDDFLQGSNKTDDNPQSATSGDLWTKPSDSGEDAGRQSQTNQPKYQRLSNQPSSTISLGINSSEWKLLEGNSSSQNGTYLLQQHFLYSCQQRLCSPLQYMFPDNDTPLDENGVAMSSTFSLLPSKYDIQRFDETIRSEMSLADPREGGGDLTLVTMIAEAVVTMIAEFCIRAKSTMSAVNGELSYLAEDFSMDESLEHDRKLVAIMFAVRNYLELSPDKTFIAPNRPAVSTRQQEAASLCQDALAPALAEIDQTIKLAVLLPLCRALNRKISSILAKISHGVYLETKDDIDEDSPGFIQSYLYQDIELISKLILVRFPPLYANFIAERIVAFSIYTYLSNASLVRPLGESARLHMTQDLADLELALEQLLSKLGGSVILQNVDQGKPYAELRAVRQMLYWTGLETNKDGSAADVTKSLLRELWMKDIRTSTICHYLFSFGPSLLSSPHHTKRIQAEEYVNLLVHLDGSITNGEDVALDTIMKCCESYQQRASSSTANIDGNPHVAQIVITLGQELSRRRQN